MDLFENVNISSTQRPLADRMRPVSLDEFVGQDHLLGPGKALRKAIEAGRLSSMLFLGAPGSWKNYSCSDSGKPLWIKVLFFFGGYGRC